MDLRSAGKKKNSSFLTETFSIELEKRIYGKTFFADQPDIQFQSLELFTSSSWWQSSFEKG